MGYLDAVASMVSQATHRATQIEIASAQRVTQLDVAKINSSRAAAIEHFRAQNLAALDLRREQAAAERERERHAAQRDLLNFKNLLDSYPYQGGPGKLRQAFHMQFDSEQDEVSLPLILLIPPDEAAVKASPWSGLGRVAGDLSSVATGKDGFIVDRLNKNVQWPYPDLYTYDLYDVPTITIRIEIDRKRLDLWIGACGVALPTRDRKTVLREQWMCSLEYFDEEWPEGLIESLNKSALTSRHSNFSTDLRDPVELNLEHASRVVRLCAIAAVDAFYLIRIAGYNEKIDWAIRAAPLSGVDIPVDLGVPLESIVDPAYHLLHRAQRYIDQLDRNAAHDCLIGAFEVLGGKEPSSVTSSSRADSNAALSGLSVATDHHLTKAKTIASNLLPHEDPLIEVLLLPIFQIREQFPSSSFTSLTEALGRDDPASAIDESEPELGGQQEAREIEKPLSEEESEAERHLQLERNKILEFSGSTPAARRFMATSLHVGDTVDAVMAYYLPEYESHTDWGLLALTTRNNWVGGFVIWTPPPIGQTLHSGPRLNAKIVESGTGIASDGWWTVQIDFGHDHEFKCQGLLSEEVDKIREWITSRFKRTKVDGILDFPT